MYRFDDVLARCLSPGFDPVLEMNLRQAHSLGKLAGRLGKESHCPYGDPQLSKAWWAAYLEWRAIYEENRQT